MTEQFAQVEREGAEMSPPTLVGGYPEESIQFIDASTWGRKPVVHSDKDGFVPIRDRIKNPNGRTDYGWSDEKRRLHLTSAHARGWKEFPYSQYDRGHDGVMIICGGGPSLKHTLPELRKLARKPKHFVFAANKTHDFLLNLRKLGLGEPVPVWGAALLDPCDWVKDYITPREGIQYFIGDQCAPCTFDVFDKKSLTKWVWRSTNPTKDRDIVPQHLRFVAGGSTVGLRMITLAYYCGFRKIHFFGFDSSAEITEEDKTGKLHGYDKPESVMMTLKHKLTGQTRQVPERCEIKMTDEKGFERTFVTNTHMGRQAQEFIEIREKWINDFARGEMPWMDFVFHGDGLLPTIAARLGLHADPKRNVPADQALVPIHGTRTYTTEQLKEAMNAAER